MEPRGALEEMNELIYHAAGLLVYSALLLVPSWSPVPLRSDAKTLGLTLAAIGALLGFSVSRMWSRPSRILPTLAFLIASIAADYCFSRDSDGYPSRMEAAKESCSFGLLCGLGAYLFWLAVQPRSGEPNAPKGAMNSLRHVCLVVVFLLIHHNLLYLFTPLADLQGQLTVLWIGGVFLGLILVTYYKQDPLWVLIPVCIVCAVSAVVYWWLSKDETGLTPAEVSTACFSYGLFSASGAYACFYVLCGLFPGLRQCPVVPPLPT